MRFGKNLMSQFLVKNNYSDYSDRYGIFLTHDPHIKFLPKWLYLIGLALPTNLQLSVCVGKIAFSTYTWSKLGHVADNCLQRS